MLLYMLLYLLNFRDKNSSSNMKIDTLSFIHCLLSSHNPGVFHPYISVLVPVSNMSKL